MGRHTGRLRLREQQPRRDRRDQSVSESVSCASGQASERAAMAEQRLWLGRTVSVSVSAVEVPGDDESLRTATARRADADSASTPAVADA